MAEEEQQPTAEALKQRRKREKAAAKDAVLGVEKFTVEVAGIFKADLKRLINRIENRHDHHLRLCLLGHRGCNTSVAPAGHARRLVRRD